MQKRLYRSRHERVIAGVCGGLAQYFAVDPTLVRIIWVLLALSGTGILLYLIALLVIPEEPRVAAEQPRAAAEQAAGREEHQVNGTEASTSDGTTAGSVGPAEAGPAPSSEPASPESRMWAGLILVAVGLYFLSRNLFPGLFFLQGRYLWPLLLVLVGAVVLAGGFRRRG